MADSGSRSVRSRSVVCQGRTILLLPMRMPMDLSADSHKDNRAALTLIQRRSGPLFPTDRSRGGGCVQNTSPQIDESALARRVKSTEYDPERKFTLVTRGDSHENQTPLIPSQPDDEWGVSVRARIAAWCKHLRTRMSSSADGNN